MEKRVIVYVDGFNLYFGLRSKGWRRHYWLNIQELSRRLLKEDQTLIEVKYFTSRVSGNPHKEKRQNTFLEALATLPDLQIYYGKYQTNSQTCSNCGHVWAVPNEKMTDVNIAVEILVDTYQDRYDTAILISADSDLVGPLAAVRRLFPDKRLIVAFPPDRSSWDLQQIAHGFFRISQSKIRKSEFPDKVQKSDGFILRRPLNWR
ncbi:NYN domain-containing protein [bacterium]|nr:NYN domain-containing protein [bacterium]